MLKEKLSLIALVFQGCHKVLWSGWLKQQKFIKIKVSAGLVSSEASPWLVVGYLPLCLHMVFSLYLPVSKFPLLIRSSVRLD